MAERGRTPGRVQGVAETWPSQSGARTGGFTAGFGIWSGTLEKLRGSDPPKSKNAQHTEAIDALADEIKRMRAQRLRLERRQSRSTGRD